MRLTSCVRLLACIVGMGCLLPPLLTVQPASAEHPSASRVHVYSYDGSSVVTTATANLRIHAPRGEQRAADASRSSTHQISRSSAAKEADEAIGGVYSLRDEAGNVVRTGRSKDLARREAEHARDPVLGRYRFQPEYRTDDYATQRGLEQLLHDDFLPPLNKIRPISPSNPRIDEYMQAGRGFGGGG